MQTKEHRNRANTEPTALQATEATGPSVLRTDPRPPESSNVIRYHARDQGHGLDNFSANIPFGLDAVAAFELAIKKKKFAGVPIRACALIVGGSRDRSRTAGIHGGEVIAEWSLERGLVAPENWREKVRGLPRPNVVPANRSTNHRALPPSDL